jgi:hypothetical protein
MSRILTDTAQNLSRILNNTAHFFTKISLNIDLYTDFLWQHRQKTSCLMGLLVS